MYDPQSAVYVPQSVWESSMTPSPVRVLIRSRPMLMTVNCAR